MDSFDRFLGGISDSTLGFRCKLAGSHCSEALRKSGRMKKPKPKPIDPPEETSI